jgi:hypothetical protein
MMMIYSDDYVRPDSFQTLEVPENKSTLQTLDQPSPITVD